MEARTLAGVRRGRAFDPITRDAVPDGGAVLADRRPDLHERTALPHAADRSVNRPPALQPSHKYGS